MLDFEQERERERENEREREREREKNIETYIDILTEKTNATQAENENR